MRILATPAKSDNFFQTDALFILRTVIEVLYKQDFLWDMDVNE